MSGGRPRRRRGAARQPDPVEEEVLRHLRQRGLDLLRLTPLRRTLADSLPPEGQERFHRLLRRYGFRIFLRDLIRDRRRIRPAALSRYVTRAQALRHLRALRDLRIVRRRGRALALAPDGVESFGDTLEWHVAGILRRDYAIPAVWGVTLRGTEHGGNFDVLALPAGRLAYLEVKSSPPKHVEEPEVAAFLDRVGDLGPDLALFVEDTALRMKDKIVPLFEAALARRAARAAAAAPRPERLRDELFHLDRRIFIVNSEPDLARNLGHCLRAYFRGG